MNVEQALAEVHRHFCAEDGTHDDACVALREATAPELCIAPPGSLCTETGCWDADRCVVLCPCGKPAAHTAAPEDSVEWACRVPNFDPQTGRILDA